MVPDDRSEKLAQAMVSYWNSFARRSDPNALDTPLWVRQTSTTDSTEALVPPMPQSYAATAFGH